MGFCQTLECGVKKTGHIFHYCFKFGDDRVFPELLGGALQNGCSEYQLKISCEICVQ